MMSTKKNKRWLSTAIALACMGLAAGPSFADGAIEAGNTDNVSGGVVYSEVRPSDGTYVKTTNTTAANLTALDKQVYANTEIIGDLDNTHAKLDASNLTVENLRQWSELLGGGTVSKGDASLVTGNTVYEATKDLAKNDLSNLTADGSTVIKNLAIDTVTLENGTNSTILKNNHNDGTVSYQVQVGGNGTVTSGNKGLISGNTLYTEVRPSADGNYIKTSNSTAVNLTALDTKVKANADDIITINANINNLGSSYAKLDASNLSTTNVASWQTKLGTGTVADGNIGLVTGSTLYNEVRPVNGNWVKTANTTAENLKAVDNTLISHYNMIRDINSGLLNYAKLDASNLSTSANILAWQKKLGTGSVADGSTGLVTGAAVYTVTNNLAKRNATNLDAADVHAWVQKLGVGKVGLGNTGLISGNTLYNEVRPANGTYVKTVNTTAANLKALDTQVKTNTDTISSINTNIGNLGGSYAKLDASNLSTANVASWQAKLSTGATVGQNNTGLVTGDDVYQATKKLANENLTNITNTGRSIIRSVAKSAIKLQAGGNVSLITADNVDGDITYVINVPTNGTVTSTSNGIISGVKLYNEVRPSDGNYVKTANTTAANLTALDTQVKTNADDIQTNADNITAINANIHNLGGSYAKVDGSNLSAASVASWQTKLGTGTVSDGSTGLVTGNAVYQVTKNLANTDLSNLTTEGLFHIKNLAANAVQLADGENTTVSKTFIPTTQETIYKINVTGDGKVEAGNTGLVSGDTLYNEVRPATDGTYVKADNTIASNLSALDTQVKTNTDTISTINSTITNLGDSYAKVDGSNLSATQVSSWQEKLGTGTVAEGNTGLVTGDAVYNALKDKADKDSVYTKDETYNRTEIDSKISSINGTISNKVDTDLGNITESGKTVIKDLAQSAVTVVDGTNTTVTVGTDEKTGAKTYAVNVSNTAIKEAVQADLDNKANIDASNIKTSAWAEKLGIGEITSTDTNLVTGQTVYNALAKAGEASLVKSDGTTVTIDKDGAATTIDFSGTNGSRIVTGITTDVSDASSAANVSYVNTVTNNVMNQFNQAANTLSKRINRVGAGAAALAALHPGDYDPENKLDFSAGYGHYKGQNAGAFGAFYHPNEDTTIGISGSIGNGDPMLNAGITFKLGPTGAKTMSRTALTKQVAQDQQVIQAMATKIAEMEQKMNEMLARMDMSKTTSTTDAPETEAQA